MRTILLLSLAFALGTTSVATADDLTPRNLPDCTKYTVPGVGTVCGYSGLEDWKAVLRADAELTHLRELATAAAAEAQAQRDRADALAAALAVREDGVRRLTVQLNRERDALAERDRLYQRERARPRWGTWISWGVAAVAVGVAGGIYATR
jgi:hypothetical protein